jgi:hypothetical protein
MKNDGQSYQCDICEKQEDTTIELKIHKLNHQKTSYLVQNVMHCSIMKLISKSIKSIAMLNVIDLIPQ